MEVRALAWAPRGDGIRVRFRWCRNLAAVCVSGGQTVCFRNHLYVFGGEFATNDQFYHYRDFWR